MAFSLCVLTSWGASCECSAAGPKRRGGSRPFWQSGTGPDGFPDHRKSSNEVFLFCLFRIILATYHRWHPCTAPASFDNLSAWICFFLNETSQRPTTVFHSPSCGNKYFYTSLKVPHPQDFQTCPFFPVCAYQQTSILPTGDFGIVLFFTLR